MMPNIEDICKKIFSDSQWILKMLVGSLLAFIPLINVFAFGYLYRYAKQVRTSGDYAMPNRTDWAEMFIDGLKFFVVVFCYGILPVAAAYLIKILLGMITFGVLGFVSLVFVSVAMVCVPSLCMSALYQVQAAGERWEELLNFKAILGRLQGVLKQLIIPSLLYAGIQFIGMPVYGIAFFVSSVLLVAYLTLLFLASEQGSLVE